MEYVISYLSVNYQGFRVNSYCGHEGNIHSMTDGKSCIDIMQKHGLYPTQGAITEVDRQGSVARMLRRMSAGKPALQIDPKCRMITKGFSGGYQRKEIAPGVYGDKVKKDIYSHIQDALQAIASGVFKKIDRPIKVKRKIAQPRRIGDSITGL